MILLYICVAIGLIVGWTSPDRNSNARFRGDRILGALGGAILGAAVCGAIAMLFG